MGNPPHFFGPKSSHWKGGKIDRSGYIYIKCRDHPTRNKQGYVAEHRLVIEKHIGRLLKREEVIHHINHIKTDNRIKNLVLCSSFGQHTKAYHADLYIKQSREFKGKHFSPETEFKKGAIPWNKDKKGLMPTPWNRGKKYILGPRT